MSSLRRPLADSFGFCVYALPKEAQWWPRSASTDWITARKGQLSQGVLMTGSALPRKGGDAEREMRGGNRGSDQAGNSKRKIMQMKTVGAWMVPGLVVVVLASLACGTQKVRTHVLAVRERLNETVDTVSPDAQEAARSRSASARRDG